MTSLRGPFSLSVLLALAGCPDKASDDTGTGTDPASTGAAGSSTADAAPTTGAGTEGTSTGGESTSESGGSGESGESSGSGTTGGVACGLVEQACAAVEAFGAYEDCGVVDPWNDMTPAWQAAVDCALKAAKEQRAFKLITWLQGFDSQVGQAYVGLTGESYAIAMFHFDSDPCGGGGCGPVASQSSCTGLLAVADCVIEPGGPCLSCAGQSEPVQICGPRSLVRRQL